MREIISVLLLTSLSLYSVTFSPLAVSISSTLADTTTNETLTLAIQVPLEENKGLVEQIFPSSEIVPIALPSRVEEKKPEVIPPKPVEKVVPTPPKELPKETKPFDIDKLAYAVAMAETGDCKKGYGVTHSNCHGIKKGNTYPCQTKPGSKMCIFKDKEESYRAFVIIWGKWYKTFPTPRLATIWTGADSSVSWRKNVLFYYNK